MHYNYGNIWGWAPWAIGFGILGVLFALVLLVAVIVLKGYALWTAAKRNEKWWFIILLIVNTGGILELVYLYFVAGKRLKDLQKMKGAVTSSETIPPQT